MNKRTPTYMSFNAHVLVTIMFLSILALSGCVLTSPYWNQNLDSHTSAVPLQAWAKDKTTPIVFECAKAYHGGLYPYGGPVVWNPVTTVNITGPGSLDPFSHIFYSASHLSKLPTSCWNLDHGNDIWYTAVRAKQGDDVYDTFDKDGLKCLGTEMGKDASVLGFLEAGCTTGTKYTIIHAES